ncbi:MAG: hypothetical protein R3B48_03375 [Kofleriaceae bacterium]
MNVRCLPLSVIPWIALGAPALAEPNPAAPPSPPPTADNAAAADATPATLDARLQALELDLEDLRGENEDLRSELADVKAQHLANRPAAPLNALNPQITAFLNGAMRLDDRPVLTPGGIAINERAFLRTAEFDFRAAVDPYADAVAILAIEDEAGEGFGAELEEAYLVLKRLPLLESAPLGLKLKIGRFRAPLGSANRLHLHDLPWTTRPLAISRLLGSENGEFFESGWNPVGVDAELILPELIPGVVMEVNADLVDGGSIAVAEGAHDHPGYVGRYNLFFTAADAHDVNLGVSGYYQPGAHRAGVLALDALYSWKPAVAGEFRSFVLGGELFYADRKFLDETGAEQRAKPLAGFAFAQLQLSWHTYLGARYEYAQELDDDTVATHGAAGYLSYYTSEFLRFRVGYERRFSDLPADDGRDSLFAEISVVFGSHPTEPYWVHR